MTEAQVLREAGTHLDGEGRMNARATAKSSRSRFQPDPNPPKVLITGGAGYIGSLLTGSLLQKGYQVIVVDKLLFGGESIIPYLHHPNFIFSKNDVYEPDTFQGLLEGVNAIVHLAALVGFPICQQVGETVAYRYNFEATRKVFELAEAHGVPRFIFASTYSNYGIMSDGRAVTEESPLNPQSLYACTKIAAEEYLKKQGQTSQCCPIIPRFATLYGISPRTRFDLIINQFVLEALVYRKLVIYQGNYHRAYVHIRDVVDALCLFLEAPEEKVRNQIFNVGSDKENYSKQEIVNLVCKQISSIGLEYKDITFGEDMRDVKVSFAKIKNVLGFEAKRSIEDGIREIKEAIESGLIKEPMASKYRNHQFIVQ